MLRQMLLIIPAVLLLVPTSLHAQLAGNQLYAGLEIGSKGVKAVVLELQWQGDSLTFKSNPKQVEKKVKEYKIGGKVVNTTLVDWVNEKGDRWEGGAKFFPKEAIIATGMAINDLNKMLISEYKIPKTNIFLAGSSGVSVAENRLELETVVNAVMKTNLGIDRPVEFIDQVKEVKYSVFGLLDAGRREDSIFIDVGSGNAKVGYYIPESENLKGCLVVLGGQNIPGATVFRGMIQKEIPEEHLGNLAFYIEKSRKINDVSKMFRKPMSRHPMLQNSKEIYLSGGIVWALTTICHPMNINDEFVEITLEDLNWYRNELTKFPTRGWPAQRVIPEKDRDNKTSFIVKQAENELARVRGTFSPEELIAGTEVLYAAAQTYRFNLLVGEQQRRKIYFCRNGLYAWIMGFVLEKAEQAAANPMAPMK